MYIIIFLAAYCCNFKDCIGTLVFKSNPVEEKLNPGRFFFAKPASSEASGIFILYCFLKTNLSFVFGKCRLTDPAREREGMQSMLSNRTK